MAEYNSDRTGANIDALLDKVDVRDTVIDINNNTSTRIKVADNGNVLIGKDSSSATTNGHELFASGSAWHTATDTFPLFLNRENSDGDLIQLRQDGATIGSIGTDSGALTVDVGGSEKMRFISTGVDVTGKVTANGLESSDDIGIATSSVFGQGLGYAGNTSSAGAGTMALYDGTTGGVIIDGFAPAYLPDSGVILKQGGIKGFHLKNNNDVSFYENTGTTAKFHWSSSAETLTVGKTVSDNSTVGMRISGSIGFMSIVRDDGEPLLLNRLGDDGDIIVFRNNGLTTGSISISGSTTSYNTSSDERLKRSIKDTTHTVDINDIRVREFDWKAGGSHQRYGFIAQELEVIYPEAVTRPDSDDEMMSVDYSKLVPLLVKEIQQLKADIKELKK